ncbi:hypothetical protein EDD18DRAFT_743390 [Armillaria luteobubalina]|uniref:RING-type domain-containing protein n=1 Tax=Armillaria luteobubalina TaxID=153913 RepID=A0AA39TVF3_9AGAR|nr:hypothetical protein EDD18DRAFT_743390 [Armillaria luteobubalina]
MSSVIGCSNLLTFISNMPLNSVSNSRALALRTMIFRSVLALNYKMSSDASLKHSTAMSTSCVCSICLSDFVDPVCTPCGHVYCSRCITEATSIQREKGSVTAPCPTCRKSFSINDDPSFRDFRKYFGYPLRRLYVNGLHVNFEDTVKRLEDRIATLERECQRVQLGNRDLSLPPRHPCKQGERNSRSVHGLRGHLVWDQGFRHGLFEMSLTCHTWGGWRRDSYLDW